VVVWYILWSFGIFVVAWFIFPRFGMLYQEKSGNPVALQRKQELVLTDRVTR
jgi:hypothetical protein